jgi:hypothetical protein
MGRPLDGFELEHHTPRVKHAMASELAGGHDGGGALACFAMICRFVHTVCNSRLFRCRPL